MKSAWIIIRQVYGEPADAEKVVKMVQKKFPDLKVKVGKTRIDRKMASFVEYPVIVSPVMAFLPTPHPNELSANVIKYTRSLEVFTVCKERKPKPKPDKITSAKGS